MSVRIAISAGEVSGDQRAAALVRAIAAREPGARFAGMGGEELRGAGVDVVVDAEKLSVMGISELYGSLRTILNSFRRMKELLSEWKPDLLIVVDFPDFNLRLAKAAAKLGIPVFYYIPPKVWAWRKSRLFTMQRTISGIGAIFPFERAYHERYGFKRTRFVGHPFVNELRGIKSDSAVRKQLFSELGLSPDAPTVAVFPGSRGAEVERHLVPMLEGLRALRLKMPDLQAVITLPNNRYRSKVDELCSEGWCAVAVGEQYRVMQSCDVGVLKSGTCNLEAAFIGLPFVCFYKAGAVTAALVRSLVKLKEFSIVNILKPKTVIELLQEEATPSAVAREVGQLLNDAGVRREQLSRFAAIVESLGNADQEAGFGDARSPADRAAALVLRELEEPFVPYNTTSRLLSFLKPYKRSFLVALGCSLVYGATEGIIPFLVTWLIKNLRDISFGELILFPTVLLIVASIRIAADFFKQFSLGKIGHYIVRDLRNALNTHLLTLGPDYFIRHSSADILSRMTSDIASLRTLLTDTISSSISDTTKLVALLVAVLTMDPTLAVITFVVFPIAILPVARFSKRMRDLGRRGQESIGSLSALVQEAVLGSKVVKVFGAEDFERERFEAENERLTTINVKSERVRAAVGPVNEALATLGIIAVLLYGASSIISGERAPEQFLGFLTAVFLMYDPFKKLSRISAGAQLGIAGAQRVFEVIDTAPRIVSPEVVQEVPARSDIEFNGVTFSYEKHSRPVLHDINLHIPQGRKVALVGFSGSGKSTLVDLIPRFIDPDQGSVRIGGVDVRKLSLEDLRARIAMVSQHTFLFNDTVYNNILYGRRTANREEVLRAMRQAYAFDFISALPHGLDTVVGEAGLTLSGGERQRIAIARAILKNAPILILDEATASLDNRSEREVQAALQELERDRTSVVIAHRLSTVVDADLIVVLKEGAIVERGTHEELLSRRGEYFTLHSYQFREREEGVQ